MAVLITNTHMVSSGGLDHRILSRRFNPIKEPFFISDILLLLQVRVTVWLGRVPWDKACTIWRLLYTTMPLVPPQNLQPVRWDELTWLVVAWAFLWPNNWLYWASTCSFVCCLQTRVLLLLCSAIIFCPLKNVFLNLLCMASVLSLAIELYFYSTMIWQDTRNYFSFCCCKIWFLA